MDWLLKPTDKSAFRNKNVIRSDKVDTVSVKSLDEIRLKKEEMNKENLLQVTISYLLIYPLYV